MNKFISIPIEEITVSQIKSGEFLSLNIFAISNKDNNNKSEFVETGFESAIPTFYNKPILAYYNPKINDTEQHNSKVMIDKNGITRDDYQYEKGERPCGVIPESAKISVVDYKGKKWIYIEGALIWREYNRQLVELLKNRKTKNVSVEIETLESYMDGDIERITKFSFLGVTILGDKYRPGIPDAHLEIKKFAESRKFANYRHKLSYALNDIDSIVEKYSDKSNTKNDIEVDKSKESISNDSWGDIDKVALKNTVLEAKNYQLVVHDVYLLVEDGWRDSPTEHLKYPVMQYRGGKFVYNAEGLLSAQQYGEQHDTKIADKAKSIRKKLGLIKSEERDNVKKFIESAEKNGFTFIGLYDNKLRFAKSIKMNDDDTDENCKCTEMSVYEIDKDKCSDTEEFSAEKLEEKSIKMADAEQDNKEKESSKEDEESKKENTDCGSKEENSDKGKANDTEKKENSEKESEKDSKEKESFLSLLSNKDEIIKEKETMCANLQKQVDEMSKELAEIKKAQFVSETDKILEAEDNIDDSVRKHLMSARDEGKYNSVEEFVKDMAYYDFLKREERRNFANSLSFDLESSRKAFTQADTVVDPIMSALDEI